MTTRDERVRLRSLAAMAAGKARRDRDVAGRVREAGFTPGVRDVPAIVALLESKDEDLLRDAERALVRVGPTLVPIVRDLASGASPLVRARLVRLVGSLVADLDAGTQGEGEAAAVAVAWLAAEL